MLIALLLVATATAAIPNADDDDVSIQVAGLSSTNTEGLETVISAANLDSSQDASGENRSLNTGLATSSLAGSIAGGTRCAVQGNETTWLECIQVAQQERLEHGQLAARAPATGLEVSQALGRGMNFGDALDAPREGDWSTGIEASHFRLVAEAGFDHVRLPVSWAGYASTSAPFTIRGGNDPTIDHPDYNNIWERVDWAIDQAEANDLMIIINMHHFEDLHAAPLLHRDRVIALWEQIATRYANAGDHVLFELLNEPHGRFTESPELWNDLLVDLLDVVRESNPTRPVLVGPVSYNAVSHIETLEVPDDDYLISSVHIYEPFDFTHQGAVWINPIRPLGESWSPSEVGISERLEDRSWETDVELIGRQLNIEFDRQWAGFALDFTDEVDFQSLRFQADGPIRLRAGCRVGNFEALDQPDIVVTDNFEWYVVDISDCPANSAGFGLLNASSVSNQVRLANLQVCSEAYGCELVVTDAAEELERWVERTILWGARNDVPVHIGELGTFAADGRVPIADRAAWTETIVDLADRHDIPFAYWEFHSHFGAYDFSRNAWNRPILDALIG